MKFLVPTLLLLLLACFGCSKSDVVGPGPFTKDFGAALRKAAPGAKVEIVQDLQIKFTTVGGKEFTFFLDNAYGLYKQDPKSKDPVIQKYITAGLDTVEHPDSGVIDRARIVAVVKDRGWLQDIRGAIADRSGQKVPESVYESLNDDLIIVYAEDSPNNIRYLTPTNLTELHIQRTELKSLASENLKQVLPKIEREDLGGGLYHLSAGGDYDASLLLLDSVWDDMKPAVSGEIVAALPARDTLLVTGSENQKALAEFKKVVPKIYAESPYHLTSKLFVRRDGKWEEFK